VPNSNTSKSTAAPRPTRQVSGIAKRRDAAKVDSTAEYISRRQQLLEAAAQVFHKKGYSRTRLTEVAEFAGIDRANIYYYVANKRELFLEVLQGTIAFESAAHLDATEKAETAAVRLRILMTDLMQRYHEHYPYSYLALQENMSFFNDEEETAEIVEQIRALGMRQFSAIRQVLKEGIENEEFASTLSSGVLAEGVVGLLGWSFTWFEPATSRYTGAEIGAAFADLLLNGLLSTPDRT
jgi:AcrR family transcriptional regulator